MTDIKDSTSIDNSFKSSLIIFFFKIFDEEGNNKHDTRRSKIIFPDGKIMLCLFFEDRGRYWLFTFGVYTSLPSYPVRSSIEEIHKVFRNYISDRS